MSKVVKNAITRALKIICYSLLILIIPFNIFIPAANAQVSQEPTKTTITGVFDYLHEDYPDGSSVKTPYLYDNNAEKAYKLETTGQKIPENYVGKQISVVGALNEKVLAYTAADNAAIFNLNAMTSQTQTVTGGKTGVDSVAVFYVNFVDKRERTMSYSEIHDYVFSRYKDFLVHSSNGIFTIQGDLYYLDLDINKTCELWNKVGLDGDLITYTKYKANENGINYNAYDHKLIILDKSLSCDHPGSSYRPAEFAYSVGTGSIAHEIGHLIGADHAGAYDCPTLVIESLCEFTRTEYWNYMDIMGSSNEFFDGDYGPYHKHRMGWLQEGSQIIDVTQNGTFALEKYENTPGSPGPAFPTKVLRIKTFNGGPAYYVSNRGALFSQTGRREGVSIEMASGDLGGYKRTALLDTTPNTAADLSDFYDGYLHDGQKVTDPYNGIEFEQLSHDSTNAVIRISFVEPSVNTGYLDVNFSRATGYLGAASLKQDVSWSPVTYIVSLKCTSNFLGCPADLGDKLSTTSTNGDLQLANGFSYEYSVDIYTKKDGDPSQTARYFWYKSNKNNVSCPGGASTCSINVDWPAVNYKVSLVKSGTNTKVCGGTEGCQDFIAIGAPATDVSFRGLLEIDSSFNLESTVEITDFSNATHLLQRVTSLGKADPYSYSCSSNSALECTISTGAGIGPFIGGESLLITTKLGDQNGFIIDGPTTSRAAADGSYTRNWKSVSGNTLWDYHVVAFPNEFSDCYSAGSKCQIQSLYDTTGDAFRVGFSRVKPSSDYHVIICAITCNPPSGNTKIADGVVRSDSIAFGPSFFPFDPFDQGAGYTGEYFDNIDFTNKKFARRDTKIDFRWGTSAPTDQLAPDTFSVRWTGNQYFEDAIYRFITTADDGIRVFIDSNSTPLIDAWNGPILNQGMYKMPEGLHTIKVEYKENTGSATVKFGFVKAYSCADINGDNQVNSIDLSLVASHFGKTGLVPWDVNGDKNVNAIDLSQVAQKFGKTCPY